MHALSLLIFPELKPKRRRLPMISDRGKFNWREKQKRIGGEKKIIRQPQKQTRKNDSKNNTDRSGIWTITLRKNCIFLVLFPHGTVGRHKAAKSKLPMSCTMVIFLFSDFFVTQTRPRRLKNISFLDHSISDSKASFREFYEFLAQCTLTFSDS